MILFLFLLLYSTYCIELELKSTRLTIRPTENAYVFGILNNEKIDYFNCTIGQIKLYNHNETINWVWKYKTKYNTKNFTSIVNIFKNGLLYTTKLNINILNYNPQITVEKNIIKIEESIVENKGTFFGNKVTSNIGNIKTEINNWFWVGEMNYIFNDSQLEYIVIELFIDSIMYNNFFIYKNHLYFSKISYHIYIPDYVVEKNFIDIIIVNIGTSNILNIILK
jgi:hypothetical protein